MEPRGLIYVKGAKLPRARLRTNDPRFVAMRRGPRLSSLERRTLMLRRFLIASAAAMLLVTTFHSDDAFARGGGRCRSGRCRSGGVLLPRRLRLRRLRQPGLPERVLSVLSGATPFGLWCSKPMVIGIA